MTERFGKISEIEVGNPDTWQDKIFLTFDIDWAHDTVLKDTIELVERAGVAATWFVTHDTPLLARLRANSNFELGIHPNFNFLLNEDGANGKHAKEIVNQLLDVVPEAKSVRSHSVTQNAYMMLYFKTVELTHDCNHFIPEQAVIELKPWSLWNGLIKVPYFWEDDVACMYDINTHVLNLIQRSGIKVFDFHPIHVFLNTENLGLYERTRTLHQNPKRLIKHRNRGYGTRSKLLELLKSHKETSFRS